jgi:XTP/dITP diphosphohydrolase
VAPVSLLTFLGRRQRRQPLAEAGSAGLEPKAARDVRARLASKNPNKLRELREALPGWELELLDADGYPPEDGETYRDNARIKARFGRKVAPPDEWVLGEDSGIEVDALDGGPGPESARWAKGREAEKLLEVLGDAENRRAHYVCELVAIAPDGRELEGRGELHGTIARELRGTAGFGFDPVFVPDGEAKTVAELGDEVKRRISHRARAARALASVVAEQD